MVEVRGVHDGAGVGGDDAATSTADADTTVLKHVQTFHHFRLSIIYFHSRSITRTRSCPLSIVFEASFKKLQKRILLPNESSWSSPTTKPTTTTTWFLLSTPFWSVSPHQYLCLTFLQTTFVATTEVEAPKSQWSKKESNYEESNAAQRRIWTIIVDILKAQKICSGVFESKRSQ